MSRPVGTAQLLLGPHMHAIKGLVCRAPRELVPNPRNLSLRRGALIERFPVWALLAPILGFKAGD